MKKILSTFALLLSVSTIQASAQGLYGELGFAEVDGLSGMEIGVGYQFMASNFTFRPIIGALMYDGELEGYFVDTHGYCRESNGRFAKDEYCNPTDIQAYGKVEAAYTIQPGFEIGAGYRFDEDTGIPYGMFAYRSEGVGIYAAVGSEYKAIGISLGASF